ncbi:inclusion body family protein [Chitinophaga eiseniae]|uniref:DNA-directed RNA polymerase subunit beta n=1 Tax=Chitinophaga eiseniae TaxID=634771 RepID=A0A847SHF0_9BACT|nr:inclusion body family protein [Chitinophaga eiseniae]NLR78455.1 DNA-directed RNA polymerase subunit beta [Chitinophaga eiseniae]
MTTTRTKPVKGAHTDQYEPADIEITIVIDTSYIIKYCEDHKIDLTKYTQDNPYPIDHDSEYMVCTGSRGIISGQGTADLNFKAHVEDTVSFRAVSASDNQDNAVILYGIVKNPNVSGNDDVFDTFQYTPVTRTGAVVVNPDKDSNGLPPKQKSVTFYSYKATVGQPGTEAFMVNFALYTLDDSGNNQTIYGYFQWDPTITVPKQ